MPGCGQRDVICNDDTLTPQEKWREVYGTDAYGNLPQWKKDQHVGHCYAPCPWSTQSSDLRTRHMLGLSSTDPLPARIDHTGADNKIYYMTTTQRGTGWGYECTSDLCSYYIANGVRFFWR